jgi:sortase (surface protein transpeptidase)
MTRPTRLTALGLAVVVAGTAGLLSRTSGAAGPTPARAAIAEQRTLTPRLTSGSALPFAAGASAAAPTQLIIPAIGVRTQLIPLSLRPSGALQVPDTTNVAGWFDDGPSPGQPGPAIIAGHVDSYKGPGVFFDLSQLRRGDRVYVRRADGTMAVFTVTEVRLYLKSAFPTTAVYGPAPGEQLRLITCGGTFDYQDRSYMSNVVVFAIAATSAP